MIGLTVLKRNESSRLTSGYFCIAVLFVHGLVYVLYLISLSDSSAVEWGMTPQWYVVHCMH